MLWNFANRQTEWMGNKIAEASTAIAEFLRKRDPETIGWWAIAGIALGGVAIAYKGVPTVLRDLLLISGGAIALATYLLNSRKHRQDTAFKLSERKVDGALKLLEESLSIFLNGEPEKPPKNDVTTWHDTARCIHRFKKIRESIADPGHKEIVEVNEILARLRFHKALFVDHEKAMPMSYFQNNGHPNIDWRAVIVIYDFASEFRGDPLWEVEVETEAAKPFVTWPPRFADGANAYLRTNPTINEGLVLAEEQYAVRMSNAKYQNMPGEQRPVPGVDS